MAATLEEITEAVIPVFREGGARLVLVFGSYGRGDADEMSDVDFIVVAETERPFVERFKNFWGVWRASPVKGIDMFVYTPDEFESMRMFEDSFVSTALNEGIVIYEAGPGRPGKPLAPPGEERSARR